MPISLIDKIKQKNNGTFKLVDAIDIAWDDQTGLVDKVNAIDKKTTIDLSGYLLKTDASKTYLAKADYHEYTLPEATDKVLGGVKIGTGISKADDGTISVIPAPSIFFANVDVSNQGTVNLTDINTNGQAVKVGDMIIDTKHDKYFVTAATPESGTKDQEGYIAASVTVGNAVGVNDIANRTDVNNALNNKVDKVSGKDLSTNDYTTDEKNKLAGLYTSGAPIFANVNVQGDSDVLVTNLVLPANYAPHVGDVIIDTAYDAYYVASVGQNADKKDIVHVAKTTAIVNPLKGLQAKLTFDEAPTQGSANPVTSGGTAKAIDDLHTTINTTLNNYAVKADIASAVNYKGSVDAFADLPSADTVKVGDMYNVKVAGGNDADGTEIKAGDNVVWNGKGWDNMGGTFVIDYATQSDIDAIFTPAK